MKTFQPVPVTPRDGGKLMTRTSSEVPGFANYVTKRDWHRILDREGRRVGHDKFWGNKAKEIGEQPYPFRFSVVEITRSGTTATAELTVNPFQVGESVILSGSTQAAYNGTFTVTEATGTTFSFIVTGTPLSPATGTIVADDPGPITLLHQARRPNGKTAIIAGTPTKLARFFALEDGAYVTSTGDDTPYVELTGDDTPYFDDTPGEWMLIGSGFSLDGNRWEAKNINGYAVFNNGVDLPCTYRLEDMAVKPIHELREQGIAAVGTIEEFSGILVCGDISQIESEKLAELLSNTSSGTTTAEQSGSTYSGEITGAQSNGSQIVTASSAIFTLGMQGKYLRFTNGFKRGIEEFTDSTHISVELPAATEDYTALPFYVVDENEGSPDYLVTASNATWNDGLGFTADMVGQRIQWANGEEREILEVLSTVSVRVNSSRSAPIGLFSVTRKDSYGPFTDGNFIDRIHYRVFWSMPDEPLRFAAVLEGSMTAGQNVLTLSYPARSLSIGMSVTVLGAGLLGGNLTANIVYISQGGPVVILDESASTTIEDTQVQATDSIGSIVGYFDLQNDASGIIRMMKLKDALVVYTDSAIFLGYYTGSSLAPFQFELAFSGSETLFYKNTLCNLKGEYHLYAGRNRFYRFSLTKRRPYEEIIDDLVSNVFYEQGSLEDTNLIFSAENAITQEIFFCFPSTGEDKALCYDYEYGTYSTTSSEYTAARTVNEPTSSLQTGANEQWFIMGSADATVLTYGKSNSKPVVSGAITCTQAVNTVTASASFFTANMVGKSIQFSSRRVVAIVAYISPTQVTVNGPSATVTATTFSVISEIYHREGDDYDSTMEGGFEYYGNLDDEKDVDRYVIQQSSQSPDVAITFTIKGTRNPAEDPVTLGTKIITGAQTQCMVPMFFRANLFQDKLVVNGINNPCGISSRMISRMAVASQSTIRRV